MRLLEPVTLAGRTAPSRVIFGPHETNLGVPGPDGRALSAAHVAYYARRAVGGCGIVVTETASVHDSDWPYERAPLAALCGRGWADTAAAVHEQGALAIASLGHGGLQGSSAYHQRALWAPSRFPDPATREVPMVMEQLDIDTLVAGFAASAALAVQAGMDGIELEAGQASLLRQFLSGLTNTRADGYGTDRARLVREVVAAVRAVAGPGIAVGLRLSCDELAPWAGITPESSEALGKVLAGGVDYIVAVRAGPFDAGGSRPDSQVDEGFALPLAYRLRDVLPASTLVAAQGSIVDPTMAEAALGRVDLVEMTRAQIADPDLVAKLADPSRGRPRPCTRCNQTCRVRDARNPIVSCIGEPRSGHELTDPDPAGQAAPVRELLVVGAGPAGLEAARVAAARGHRVRVIEQSDTAGGAVTAAARGARRDPLALLTGWLVEECDRLGVTREHGRLATAADLDAAFDAGTQVVVATGSVAAVPPWRPTCTLPVLTARQLLEGAELPAGIVVIDDPIGGPVGISVAENLAAAGIEAHLVSQDVTVGTQLARTGDLAAASGRLARAGVTLHKRSRLLDASSGGVVIEDRYTGATTNVPAALVVDAGPALPHASLADGREVAVAGDAVAPRTIAEAVLEGRRAALAVER
ncbi:MAG TPA: mycofactocin system FadH/OYE family oxidoreductase 1 [Mycobacteriales bacterium]|nr:mycofactocin system FadH/OYE family oxidoreductase 1 [Mycobacteriales bacterium]